MDSSRAVHFVGSIGLDHTRDVFDEVGRRLEGCLRRVPDGEIGGRRQWISYQIPVLRSYRFLKPVPPNMFVPLDLSEDFEPTEAHFSELGYAREARVSYEDFLAARNRGSIPQTVRFQVCMPTPFAVLGVFLTPRAFAALEEAYTAAMLAEVEEICSHIPHTDLAFQWDVCPEMMQWDVDGNANGLLGDNGRAGILARMKRLSDAIPADVQHGYHFCFGNFDGGDDELPRNARGMVSFYQALSDAVSRPLNWVHFPIPGHADESFFADLDGLNLRPETELFLGVVHDAEDEQGTARRISMAREHVPSFGVATRCGIARDRSPESVLRLLDAHAKACKA